MRRCTAVGLCALMTAACGSGGDRFGSIRGGLAQLTQHGDFAGVVLVAKDGKPVFTHAYGAARLDRNVPNRIDTKFNLASLGKTFTGVAIAQLVQVGKLRFADKIGRYLPQLPASLGRTITIAELLDHSSGLGDFFQHPDYGSRQPRLTTLAAYLPLIADQMTAFRPGARFSYSNSGYILLGLIVERVSGESYYGYLERHIFRPAGMAASGCFRKDELPPDTAIGYLGMTNLANTASLPPRGTSAGGCYSTAGDLLRFANALFSHRLLDTKLTRAITTPKIRDYGYGFGIRRGERGEPPTIWHNGGSPGVATELDMNPGLGYTVVVLSNRDPEFFRPAIDLILNALRIP